MGVISSYTGDPLNVLVASPPASPQVLATGARGPKGPKGDPFRINAQGLTSELSLYDNEENGFSFLAVDSGLLYLRDGETKGVWSDPIVFGGPQGIQGESGRGINGAVLNAGRLVLSYSDGQEDDLGNVQGPIGPAGPTGPAGLSITEATVDVDGYLILTYSNSATLNAGYVRGLQGTPGIQGNPGPAGPAGRNITAATIDNSGHLILNLSDASELDAGLVVGESGSWGSITGLLSNQTDLAEALNNKVTVVAGKGLSTEDYSSAEKTKLAAIAANATANATDAQLRDRSTHTGTQTASTISDLTEAVQDIVGAAIVAGTNVTINYNDTTGQITISATGGGVDNSTETVAISAGALNLSTTTKEVIVVSLSQNVTSITLPSGVAGQAVNRRVVFTQSGAANFTVTGWTGVTVEGGTAPVAVTGVGAVTEYMLTNTNNGGWRMYVDQTAVGTPAQCIPIACSDESTALTAGNAKVTFRMPYAFTLSSVRASLTTPQTSGAIFTVDINENGTSILSTKLTIDNTEKSSVTAATAAVISDTSLANDAEITIDIDQIGDGTAKGLKVYLIGVPA